MPTATALVRVDDVGSDDDHDRTAVAGLLDAGLAISCAVVPGWLDEPTVRFLEAMRDRHGPRLEVHQHGWQHVDRRGGGGAEFGAFRDRDEQRAELRQGLEVLTGALGDLVWTGFSPPYGAHDPAVLEDLRGCGFHAVSTLRPTCRLAGLPDFPTGVDWFAWAPVRRERSWPEVEAEWRRQEASPYLGLVLHPRFMARERLGDLGERVAELTAGRRTLTLRELAAELPDGA